jgi:hypothetical protein
MNKFVKFCIDLVGILWNFSQNMQGIFYIYNSLVLIFFLQPDFPWVKRREWNSVFLGDFMCMIGSSGPIHQHTIASDIVRCCVLICLMQRFFFQITCFEEVGFCYIFIDALYWRLALWLFRKFHVADDLVKWLKSRVVDWSTERKNIAI